MPTFPGRRIRDNGVFGTITDNPLTAGAVTFNSPDLVRLSAISGNHAVVTLDPLREHGDPEIVIVTTHSASASVATITRGAYGTTAQQHPVGTLWVHAALDDDFIEVLTSGTRPSNNYEGQLIYETDTDFVVGHNGSGWGKLGSLVETSPYSSHFQANPPACRAYNNANVNVPNATVVTIPLNSERFDTNGMHSTSVNTSRITFVTAGLYIVTGHLDIQTNAAGIRFVGIELNGSSELAWQIAPGRASGGTVISVSTVYKFVAGDYVELLAFQDSGGTLAAQYTVGQAFGNELSATWIGIG